MSLKDATPYWMARHEAVSNDFATDGMALLTAANMSGKSTLLRTVTAAALLANCGLCVPASSAVVPAFDVIFLRNTAYDAPKEGKSSFGVEMSDIRDLLAVVTPRSLVMVDELGKGTSSSEGAALSGAILEHFSSIGCYGVFASHLFELFELPMEAANLELLTMEVVVEDIVDSEAATSDGSDGNGLAGPEGGLLLGSPSDGGLYGDVGLQVGERRCGGDAGHRRVVWTYRVKAGQADSSLALDAARHFGVPGSILDRAHELLKKANAIKNQDGVPMDHAETPPMETQADESLADEFENAQLGADVDHSKFVVDQLRRLCVGEVSVKTIVPDWAPPSKDRMRSVVYALCVPSTVDGMPDGRWYVGETDDLYERMREHRADRLKRRAT